MPDEITITYVDIFRWFGETSHNVTMMRVASRDLWGFTVPGGTYAIQFYDLRVGDEVSQRLNVSPICYYGGRIMTLQQVQAEFPDERDLIYGMVVNGYKAVRTPFGEFYPFNRGDVLIGV